MASYKEEKKSSSFGDYLYKILMTFIWCIAVYLSIRCNGGFDLGAFLVACICSPFYIVYKLAMMPKDVMELCINK